ncbi:hypothetical protein [Prosthecobacter dejongeii]|uniref:Transmembrane protein n=1 Tax=Prosthecobacter dejongeii TaxID=48465 RepID=A0A7W7YHQ9_9BACT|nr:hypothetical protein [Prosthecobacter dejongeii]MBB5036430.1 hypothetical protein [Prosthecobacter dejongeii]
MKLKHKFSRTFVAMFWGWVACNIVTFLISWGHYQFRFDHLPKVTGEMPLWVGATAAVIFGAWLLVFLPVDLCVSETSRWRHPKPAALAGGVAGFLTLFVPSLLNSPEPDVPDLLAMSLLAAVCGLTASLYLARRYPVKSR